MLSNQNVPSFATPRSRLPVGWLGLKILVGYSVILSVFGSNFVTYGSPKSVYQTAPSLSTTMSCGSVVGRSRSYSVTMARVDGPLARGLVLSSYFHVSVPLRLIVARYSPNRRYCSGVPARDGS